MNVINFIIDNILTQASITISLIAMLGLILQKKIGRANHIRNAKNSTWFSGAQCWFKYYCW